MREFLPTLKCKPLQSKEKPEEYIKMPETYPHLFWAYSAIWLLIFAGLFFLGLHLSSLRKRVGELENRQGGSPRGDNSKEGQDTE